MPRLLEGEILCGVVVIAFATTLHAQVKQTRILDIAKGLNDSTLHDSCEPALDSNKLARLFDGNPYTETIVQNTDSFTITLRWNDAVKISKSKLFCWINGTYTLEAARSEANLNGQTGSYQVLAQDRAFTTFRWDSLSFAATEFSIIRLSTRAQFNNTIVGEWMLEEEHTLTSLLIIPKPPRLLPGTYLQLSLKMMDESGSLYPYTLGHVVNWSSSNPSVAIVDDVGRLDGVALGSAEIRATTPVLSGSTIATVEADFVSPRAPQRVVKVALILQDPVIDLLNKRKIHQVRGWDNPLNLTNQLLDEFSEASGGAVQFQIVESHDDQVIFSRLDGQVMTIDTLAYYFSSASRLYGRNVEGTLQHLAEVEGRVRFDYNAIIDYYDLDSKRNNGIIDEVWVYAYHFASMYESILAGPNAFWWNAPPLNHPGLEKLLSIMGLNYERGIPEAMESFGHRMESALWKAFGRWDGYAQVQNHWELFTTIDKDRPGQAQVGNIHYPPNGMSDYDYNNTRYVICYADN